VALQWNALMWIEGLINECVCVYGYTVMIKTIGASLWYGVGNGSLKGKRDREEGDGEDEEEVKIDELVATKVLLLQIDSYESAGLNTQIIHMFLTENGSSILHQPPSPAPLHLA